VDDNPDQRLDDAEPIESVLEAKELAHKPEKGPYHQAIAPELVDDLALCIGQGLALIGQKEQSPPEHLIDMLARYIDAVLKRKRRLTKDPSDAVLALACLYGQELARAFGWGFAHLRRAKKPGIVLVSPDRRHVAAPRDLIGTALAGGGGKLVLAQYRCIRDKKLPEAKARAYLRI
jgi:hypothetical protein